MNITDLKNWVVVKRFHSEECRYYYTATLGRDILTSDDGVKFSGLVDGVWV